MAKNKKLKPNQTVVSSSFNITTVKPITVNQEKFFTNYDSNKSQLLLGYPGTGKTYLSMYKALSQLESTDNDYKKLVIVRSVVPTRDMGFLPGNITEKSKIYEQPYIKICTELFNRGDAYEILKKQAKIEFLTTSFIRGITLNNSVILVDELQNLTAHEADSILTRVGQNSKIIFCGDLLQQDLSKSSEKNINLFIQVLSKMSKFFDFNHFELEDIVRSGLVGNYIKTKHEQYPKGY